MYTIYIHNHSKIVVNIIIMLYSWELHSTQVETSPSPTYIQEGGVLITVAGMYTNSFENAVFWENHHVML